LLKNGNLAGLQYEFIIREGNVWEQLEFIIQEKHIDAVVVGTHRREGLGRLMLGSVAEQIFRQANCLVLTEIVCAASCPVLTVKDSRD
jgi:nucleotide-binding universal stress UspA family protein